MCKIYVKQLVLNIQYISSIKSPQLFYIKRKSSILLHFNINKSFFPSISFKIHNGPKVGIQYIVIYNTINVYLLLAHPVVVSNIFIWHLYV